MQIRKVFNHLFGVNATEHRNMPLESAISMILRSYEEWLVNNRDSARDSQQSEPPQAGRHVPHSEFKQPDDSIIRMLQMVIDGRCLVVEELDTIIDYFQQQRNVMAKAQGLASASKSLTPGSCIVESPHMNS